MGQVFRRRREVPHAAAEAAKFHGPPMAGPGPGNQFAGCFVERHSIGQDGDALIGEREGNPPRSGEPAPDLHEREEGDEPSLFHGGEIGRFVSIRLGKDPGPCGSVEDRRLRVAGQPFIPPGNPGRVENLQLVRHGNSLSAQRPAMVAFSSAETRESCSPVNSGYIGNDTNSAAAFSATGNPPFWYPSDVYASNRWRGIG